MTDKNVIDSLTHVLNANSIPETKCNHELCDEHFDSEVEKCQEFACIAASAFTNGLGDHFAHEQAMLALFGNIHAEHGAAACLSTLKELVSALKAWEQLPSRERVQLVK